MSTVPQATRTWELPIIMPIQKGRNSLNKTVLKTMRILFQTKALDSILFLVLKLDDCNHGNRSLIDWNAIHFQQSMENLNLEYVVLIDKINYCSSIAWNNC